MINCEVAQDLLPGYVERLTSDGTNREMEAHLEGCEACRAALEAMRAAPGREAPVPARKLHPFRRVRRRYLLWAVGAALAVALAATGVLAALTGSIRFPLRADDLNLPVAAETGGGIKIGLELKERKPLGHYVYYSRGAEDGARYITIYWIFGFGRGGYPRAAYADGGTPVYYGTGPEDENRVLLWEP